MLGIIGAMQAEVEALKDGMQNPVVERAAGMAFYKGIIEGKEAVVVQSGIGKVNAALCVQILADRFGVSAVVNTGVAGSLKAEINIGDLVLSTDAVQHDMEVGALGYAPGQIPGIGVRFFEADAALRSLAKSCCEAVCPELGIFEDRIVSGDQFISDKAKKDWLTMTFGGACAEMEGAAVAQAAYLNGIPFLVIRAISDKADDSAFVDYPAFERQAIENSIRLVRELIRRY